MNENAKGYDIVETDVLVVGGGGAGFRAAIGARERGADTTLVSKGALARSGASPLAGADLTADGQGLRAAGFFGEPRDTKDKFFSDIVHQGCFLNDQRLVEIYVRDAPDRLIELLSWGVRPRFTDERAIFTTGTSIMDALQRHARKVGVKAIEDVMILELLIGDGKISGALGLDVHTGQFVVFKSKAVVLGSGGWHKAYTPITGSRELTGDGVAMAYRAGAGLANMEFVTFCCNVLFWPPAWSGSILTYVMSMIIGGGLVNGQGERFLDQYDPSIVHTGTTTEWNKSFISFATMREVRAGRGSPHGGAYYTTGDIPWDTFEARAMRFYPGWRYKGADFAEMGRMLKEGEGVEVGPAAEYFEGGIAVGEQYETGIPGLYAAGECAMSLFGSNRVSAATTEMVVTGAVAGWAAGEYASATDAVEVKEGKVASLQEAALRPLQRSDGARPSLLRKRLQEAAQEKLSPIRTEGELKELLALLNQVKRDELPALYASSKSRRYNKEWIEALELVNIVQVLEASAQAALERRESRGVHFREDYPTTDNDQWLKELVVTLEDGQPRVSTRPATATTLAPPKGTLPYLDMIKRMMEAHSDIGGHH